MAGNEAQRPTITLDEWRRTPSDYKTGRPQDGSAKVLRLDPETGATVLQPVDVLWEPRFKLGQVVATPGALEVMARRGISPASLLGRHVRGDWGDLDEEDKRENEFSVPRHLRIVNGHFKVPSYGQVKVPPGGCLVHLERHPSSPRARLAHAERFAGCDEHNRVVK